MAKKLQIIGSFPSGEVDPNKVKTIVDDYLNENPPSGGVSPTIEVEKIEGGHRVTVIDVNGSQSFDVFDGVSDSAESNNVVEF